MKKTGFGKIGFTKIVCITAAFCVATAVATHAQNSYLNTLFNFDGKDGLHPNGALVQGFDGNYYGVTAGGTAAFCEKGCGTVFRLTPKGKVTTIYDFCTLADCADGDQPNAGLTLGNNGNFYGTTSSGGTKKKGTVFEITPGGELTTLYSFCQIVKYHVCVDGAVPVGVVESSYGYLYGVTTSGGQAAHCSNCGTVYQLTPAGALTTLHAFCDVVSNELCVDGTTPITPLIEGSNGKFYGVTPTGGATGGGNVFEIDAAGVLHTIYSFCSETPCTDGYQPFAGLIQTINGQLAGTTYSGGAYDEGTIFEITTTGALTTLYSFCPVENSNFSCDDGQYPRTGVVQQPDGTLLGTSTDGGPYTYGTIYQLTESGTFTVLYSFCANGSNCIDGELPDGLLMATNGYFYGATAIGGETASDCYCDGTLYSMLPADGGFSFVEAVPNSGEVGRIVNILGTGLTGSTAVTFNGTAAEFTVVSDSRIKATVPSGATTGPIVVTTPSFPWSSILTFEVK